MKKTNNLSVGEIYGLFLTLKAVSLKPSEKLKAESIKQKALLNIINYLKLLWKGYSERQAYRKKVQKRLLRQRALKRERASTPLSLTERGHWTDRFLKSKEQGVRSTDWLNAESLRLKAGLTMMLLFVSYLGFGQEVKPLKVGDRLPDVLYQLLEKQGEQPLRGKLLILDFWSTTCGTCVSKLPEIDSLNNVLKDKIQIIPITSDPLKRVDLLLERRPNLKSMGLTRNVADSLFVRAFPYAILPHEVWISAEGKYLGATESEYVNGENIREVLTGKPLGDAKVDILGFDPKSQKLSDHYTAFYVGKGKIGTYIDGLRYGSGIVKTDTGVRYYIKNAPILQLYALAINSPGYPFIPKRRILPEGDSSSYLYQSQSGYQKEWEAQNSYWYEVEATELSDDLRRQLLLQDVNKALGLKGELVEVEDSVVRISYSPPQNTYPLKGLLSFSDLIFELDALHSLPIVLSTQKVEDVHRFYLPPDCSSISYRHLSELLAAQGIIMRKTKQMVQKFKLSKTTL